MVLLEVKLLGYSSDTGFLLVLPLKAGIGGYCCCENVTGLMHGHGPWTKEHIKFNHLALGAQYFTLYTS